jgi:hypothetical protein
MITEARITAFLCLGNTMVWMVAVTPLLGRLG